MRENQMSIKDVVTMAVEIGTKTAISEMKTNTFENIRKREDRRLHNTRMLLENYRLLTLREDRCKLVKSKSRPLDILEDIEALMDNKFESVLESVKRSEERTNAMIQYINDTLKLYKIYAKSSKIPEDWRRYTVMYLFYISKMRHTNDEIAAKLHLDVRSIQRDKTTAIQIFSRFLWGVDNFKMSNFVSYTCR
jgi:hypothetical protein